MAIQREWFEKDYYAILGVPSTATPKEVTSAYRALARKLHPDANPGNPAAEERFKEVSAAYDVIGDPDRRREYDEARAMGPMGGMGGMGGAGPFGRGGGGGGGAGFDAGDIGDLLGNLFGRGGGQARGPSQSTFGRGADLEADLHISFLDALRGVTTSVSLVSDAPCIDCQGAGTAPGTSARPCSECSGRGVLDENQGFFSFSRPCQRCQGSGRLIDHPCLSCSGSGVTRRPRTVKVRLPEGVKDGQTIRLKGKGAPGRQGGPAGDLYVRLDVEPHPLFRREEQHLRVTVPITFAEAALGADVRVPTTEGDAVTIRIPEATRSGRVFRVRGRGVPGPQGRGDLLVAVEVTVPTSLSAQERRAIEALRDAATSSPRDALGV
ncbi:MAG: molecular chaperone DnaJ [Microthrixaceae bacterium]|nr:molecular chaperone DnaJ [Microthrixaceae bacterium]HMT23534.1 molecular chaperone DnaJ [Microthrixaceae bacterium]HMT59549.1 molecular chaperone DnaJ [Microthrixaceae bacterium]